MGALNCLDGHRLYLDANVIIYAVEGLAEWAVPAQAIFRAVDAGRCTAVTSELTLSECLVKPAIDGRADIAEVYHGLIRTTGGLTAVPVSREVLVEAASIRAATRAKLPDAIHIASARRNGCTAFVSNDDRLRSAAGEFFVALTDVSPS